MARMTLLYFASLRERAGIEREMIESAAQSLSELYDEASQRHSLTWPKSHLRVAMDGEFARWEDLPRTGSEIAFIPPVSGG